MRGNKLLALLAVLCLSLSVGLSEVVVLEGTSFDSVVGDGFWFIDFYAPWCGFCKILAPIWEDTSNRYTSVHFAKMDCTLPDNKGICHKFGIHSYPTLKIFHKGVALQEYSGHRTSEAFISFCESIIRQHAAPPTPEPTQAVEEPVVEVIQEIEQPAQSEGKAPETPQEEPQRPTVPAFRKKEVQRKASYLSNTEGKLVILNDANFEKETKQGNWFIKFYAPWCGHCKKLAPVWEELAGALKGKVNVGKVDCDAESVCDKFGVSSFPTLKFFVDGYSHDFREKRSLETLINFANRMSGEPLVEIDQAEYEKLRKEKDLFFLLLQAEGAQNLILEELSKKFMSISNFFTSSDPALLTSLGVKTPPSLLVSQNGELSFFKSDINSQSLVEKWITEHKYPLFGELDSSNAGELLESEDIVVMLIADPDQPEFSQKAKPEMVKAAIQYSREIKQGISRSTVYFVWINGAVWESYVTKNYDVTKAEFPSVVVMRPSLNLYFNVRSTGEKVKVESKAILSLVRDVEKERVQGKNIGGFLRGIFASIQRQAKPILNWINQNIFIVIGGVVLFTIGLTWLLISSGPSDKIEKAE